MLKAVNELRRCFLLQVLHVPNSVGSDSVKIAGLVDLYRVQGRWSAAAWLAWVRYIAVDFTSVSIDEQLSKAAPSIVLSPEVWETVAFVFDKVWQIHINNVTKLSEDNRHPDYLLLSDQSCWMQAVSFYRWFLTCHLYDEEYLSNLRALGLEYWTKEQTSSFVHFAVRGFLRNELYNSVTEFMSRVGGSFGWQLYSTLEPGVVVLDAKGQPMTFAFDPR